jgi:BirA family biotin operon repressor/biotin-[acetyl-CoA-carboxylase] ligase
MSGAARIGSPIVRLGETESTNDVARHLARVGVREGAVVVAERQTRGRGRLGRPWMSPPGGLWCSVLLRPDGDATSGLLSLAVGVAVAEAVEEAAGIRAGLKWPNDVVVGDRKVAGVLLETAGGAVVAGIGVNVAVEAFGKALGHRAVSLHAIAARVVTRETVFEHVLRRVAVWYDAWQTAPHRVVQAWRSRDTTCGRAVMLSTTHETLSGTADGIDDDGALRLRLPHGEVRRVVAGDLQPGDSGAPGA